MNGERFDSNQIPAHWRPAVRVDVGRLARATKTAVGVRVEGVVARAGVLSYRRSDGSTIREYLPPEEAGRLDSLATLRDAPVTVSHPGGGTRMVTPASFRADTAGHVSGEPRFDGQRVTADLAIQEESAIERVDRGDLVELSSGYRLMIDPTPGVSPSGERYDAIQRNRVYNHVALLPRGQARAGAEASLRLDGVESGADIAFMRIDEDDRRAPQHAPQRAHELEMRADTMKTERIDGVDYEIGSTAWQQARARFDEKHRADQAALEKRVTDAEAKATTEKARADSAEQKVKGLEAQLAPEAIAKRVSDRSMLLNTALPILGIKTDSKEAKELEGKTDHQIRVLVIEKLDPSFKVDSIEEAQRETYARARFDGDTRNAAKDPRPTPLQAAKSAALPVIGAPGNRADAGTPAPQPYVPLMQRMAAGFVGGNAPR